MIIELSRANFDDFAIIQATMRMQRPEKPPNCMNEIWKLLRLTFDVYCKLDWYSVMQSGEFTGLKP